MDISPKTADNINDAVNMGAGVISLLKDYFSFVGQIALPGKDALLLQQQLLPFGAFIVFLIIVCFLVEIILNPEKQNIKDSIKLFFSITLNQTLYPIIAISSIVLANVFTLGIYGGLDFYGFIIRIFESLKVQPNKGSIWSYLLSIGGKAPGGWIFDPLARATDFNYDSMLVWLSRIVVIAYVILLLWLLLDIIKRNVYQIALFIMIPIVGALVRYYPGIGKVFWQEWNDLLIRNFVLAILIRIIYSLSNNILNDPERSMGSIIFIVILFASVPFILNRFTTIINFSRSNGTLWNTAPATEKVINTASTVVMAPVNFVKNKMMF